MPPTPGPRKKESSSDSSGATHPRDPPRPPRDGKEWVWYPEGYWAERVIRDGSGGYHHQPADSNKSWKWKSGSSKSKSSSDEPRTSSISPRSLLQPQLNPAFLSPVPPSPYISESAHVHSLQHPEGDKEAKNNSSGGAKDWMKNIKRPSPGTFRLNIGTKFATQSKPTNCAGAGLLSNARKELGTALRKNKGVIKSLLRLGHWTIMLIGMLETSRGNSRHIAI